MSNERLLEGKLALVTGGSRGLGRAICEVFAREGADVAFSYLRAREQAEETLSAIRSHGRRGWAFCSSVVERSSVDAMVQSIEQQAGSIDVLVNNAGFGQVLPLALMEEEDWDRMFDVLVKGTFLVTRAVLRGMVRKRSGRIVNIGSLAGVKMMEAPVHYCAAKAAIKGATEALAKEVGRYGITVNCLAPGVLEQGVSDNLSEARRADYLGHCSLGRVGKLSEIAEVAAFVASARNSYMSGATIVIDGAV